MKTTFCAIILSFMFSMAYANGPFEKVMGESIPAIFSAENPESLQDVINKLDRVGSVEKDRWEPNYYAAFGYLRMSHMFDELKDKDKYLDLALESVAKGEEVQPNDSELETLRGYILMMKLNADPANRGMQYSGMVFGSFQKAIGLNPQNPRAHFMLGQMQYGTAQFMGGGNEEACATLANAVQLYSQETTGDNPFAPSWGKDNASKTHDKICKGEE